MKYLLLVAIVFSLSGCYVLRQASFFLDYNGQAVDNKRLLDDKYISVKTEEFLLLIILSVM